MSYLKRWMQLAAMGRCLALLIVMSFAQIALAQSTLFNIPSTDVVAGKKVYTEFDYFANLPKQDSGMFQWFVPRAVVGVGANIEAGANVLIAHTPGITNTYFQPNIKWKFLSSEMKGVAGSGGIIWYTPMNNRESTDSNGVVTKVDSYGLVYGNFSKKFTGTYGPRFTAGPYGIVGANDGYIGTKAGAIIGLEQPVHPKMTIVADWFSGVSGFGYFTPGVSVTLPHSSLLNVGYSIGNDSYESGNNNRALFIYYGITLN